MQSSDIRKWFMKSHDKAKAAAANGKDDASTKPNSKPTISLPEKPVSILSELHFLCFFKEFDLFSFRF